MTEIRFNIREDAIFADGVEDERKRWATELEAFIRTERVALGREERKKPPIEGQRHRSRAKRETLSQLAALVRKLKP